LAVSELFQAVHPVYVIFFSSYKIVKNGHPNGVIPQQQIDINQLNQAKANVTLTQTLLSQAIEKSSSDPTLAQEAIKQAAQEIAQAQSSVNQVYNTVQAQQAE
jgi:hypothetical protein